nr:MAG TPA: hypothetical protein [Caudoviricetes sp.]
MLQKTQPNATFPPTGRALIKTKTKHTLCYVHYSKRLSLGRQLPTRFWGRVCDCSLVKRLIQQRENNPFSFST